MHKLAFQQQKLTSYSKSYRQAKEVKRKGYENENITLAATVWRNVHEALPSSSFETGPADFPFEKELQSLNFYNHTWFILSGKWVSKTKKLNNMKRWAKLYSWIYFMKRKVIYSQTIKF